MSCNIPCSHLGNSVCGVLGKANKNGASKKGKSLFDDEIPDQLSFERIINGHTCPPCTLNDFTNFLRYVEEDADKLQFFLWARDYTKRFNELSEIEKGLSPPWNGEANVFPIVANRSQLSLPRPDTSSTQNSSSIPSGTVFEGDQVRLQPFTIQPFHEEIDRISSLYLLSGSALELSIPLEIKCATLQAFATTTHPSALSPVLNHIEPRLRQESHPNFIRYALANANPYRVYTIRMFGFIMLFLGFVMSLILVLSHVTRWARLSTVLFIFGGVLGIVNSRKGFCLRLMIEGQMRHQMPWEVYEVDEEKGEKGSSSPSVEKEDKQWRFDLDDRRSEELRVRVFVKEFENKLVLSRVYERRVKVEDKDLQRLQRRVMIKCLIVSAFITLVYETALVVLPKGNLF